MSAPSLWGETAAIREGRGGTVMTEEPWQKGVIAGSASWQQGDVSHTHKHTHLHILLLSNKHTRWDTLSKLIRAVDHIGHHSLGAESRKYGEVLNLDIRYGLMDDVTVCQSTTHLVPPLFGALSQLPWPLPFLCRWEIFVICVNWALKTTAPDWDCVCNRQIH